MVPPSKRKWQEKNIADRQNKDPYSTLHERMLIPKCQWTKCEDLQQKLCQKQWEQLFLSLYKNAKQKEAFEIQ